MPEKLKSPADLKALYRLCDCEQVTHEAIITSTRKATLASLDGLDVPVLILQDSTELDYTSHKSLAGQLSQIGRGLGRGYLCHNSLAVEPDGRHVLGLTGQVRYSTALPGHAIVESLVAALARTGHQRHLHGVVERGTSSGNDSNRHTNPFATAAFLFTRSLAPHRCSR